LIAVLNFSLLIQGKIDTHSYSFLQVSYVFFERKAVTVEFLLQLFL
jgi:hypothetical protein